MAIELAIIALDPYMVPHFNANEIWYAFVYLRGGGGINAAAKSPCPLATAPTAQECGKLKFWDQQLVIVKPSPEEST